MTKRQGRVRPQGFDAIVSMLRNSRRLLLTLALLVGAGAVAAVLTPTVPPTYCTNGLTVCFDTLDKAEASMRSAPAFAGVGELLEHMQTIKFNATTLRMQYRLRDRPAETVRAPSYYAVYGTLGNSLGTCPLGDDQTALPGWCADQQTLVNVGLARIQQSWAASGCTITSNVVTDDYEVPNLESSATTYGNVNYGYLNYKTTGTCANGSTINHNWDIRKRQPLYCRQGFGAISTDGIDVATLMTANVCEADNESVPYIAMPILQCATCAGSRHPVYPATGEKQRAEPDFTFAGQTFTRYYRSIRQFRNNSSFAVAWNHSWSDRIIGGAVTATPYVHIDEIGNYEGYTLLSGSRYRGETSVDRVLERINANGISFQLRMPDGEVRKFDTSGYLIAIRNPNDPLNDITITYNADKAMSTVTDAQGRVLRFEYADNLLQRIVLPDGTDVAYDYDANLNLTAVTYPGGATKHYHYNEPGLAGDVDQRHHLTGITSEDGQRFASFGYDARGRVTSSRVLGTPNELTTVSYPTEDNALLVTSSGDTNEYTIQSGIYRRVVGIKDGAGTEIRAYTEGRLQRQVDRLENVTEYTYQDGFRRTVTTGVGTTEERKTETIRDPVSGLAIEQRAYDKAGVLLVRSAWTYNARNQVVSAASTDPQTGEARITTTAYCESDDIAANVCPEEGLVKSVDGPRSDVADVTRYEYRMADYPSCSVTPNACPYRKGDLWRATNAAGHIVEILRRDGSGRLLSQRDANGVVTDFEYDPRGRLLANKVRGTNDGSETDDRIGRFEYGPNGARSKAIYPDGTVVRYFYDGANRLTSIKDGADNVLSYALDESGRRVREEIKDAAGVPLWHASRTFNTLGQLAVGRNAYENATSFSYDKEGNQDLVTDALGRVADYDYDAHGRLLRMVLDKNGLAAGTSYRYDTLDNLTEVIDSSGLATNYAYNAFGEVIDQYSPDTGNQRFSYDSAGNLRTKTDARGIVTAYTYDALNRMTGVSYPNSGKNETYAYDEAHPDCLDGERFAKGLVGRMFDATGNTGYCYDRYGNVTRKLQMTQGRTYVLRYLHTDPRGRLPGQDYLLQNPPPGNQMIGWTYPDGAGVRIVRDALGRSAELRVTLTNGQTKTLLTGASYYPFGPVARWTFGNGRVLSRSVNENYQPGFVEDTSSGGINEGYWFNVVGNLESLQYANQAAPSRRRYTYDGLNRLTHVRDGATDTVLQEYAYDAIGNRTKKVESGVETAYVYAPARHHLTQIGTQGRSYDDSGNTTRIEMTPASGGGGDDKPPGGGDPGPDPVNPIPIEAQGMRAASFSAMAVPNLREFEYDDTNRMSAVKHDGVAAMNYLYNGVGERVYRTGPAGMAASVYDQAGHWIGDYGINGQSIQQVIWLDDLPVGLLVGAGASQKLFYIEADALGTPRVVIDPDRNVAVWRWDLAGEAFGDSVPNEDVDNDGLAFVFDMRFQGQRYDSATGMSYNYMRDYDAETGRYAQSDPIGLAGGISTYGYVSGRPMNLIDRYGMDGTCPVVPSYNPSFWNSESVQSTNNCYSYAWDRPESLPGQRLRGKNCRPQPGGFKCNDTMEDRSTCQKIISQSIRDGMKRAKNGQCSPCMRRVFLVMGNNRDGNVDYHWYRQDADGTWSHKPGLSTVTNLDASGQPISDPELADRNNIPRNPKDGYNYNRKCGYLCVPM